MAFLPVRDPVAEPDGGTSSGRASQKRAIKNTPVRRLGAITDVSDAAFFLCSEAVAFITGVTLMVDGGLWLASRRVASEWDSL
jgi:NAD(P)-dependent dehydrogenase (short-subunit alcohol dehydrogenase family)